MTAIAIFNPEGRPIEELPAIFGFNNGGAARGSHGLLLAEDGAWLGSHICSDEGFMLQDLGILEGCRLDRHAGFRAHYPKGYRMEFVPARAVLTHAALIAAIHKARA